MDLSILPTIALTQLETSDIQMQIPSSPEDPLQLTCMPLSTTGIPTVASFGIE